MVWYLMLSQRRKTRKEDEQKYCTAGVLRGFSRDSLLQRKLRMTALVAAE